MKIIIATGIFPPDIGGPATYCEKLAKEFKKRGMGVQILCYSDVKQYGNYDFSVIRISRKIPKGLRHFLYFLKLLKLAKHSDIIYAQNPVSAGLPSLWVTRILNKKLVVKIVGDYAWEQAKGRWRIAENLEDFQKRKYNFKIELLKKIQKKVAKKAQKIIVPSFYLKGIVKIWGVSEKNIEMIYNAVEDLAELNISKEEAKKKLGIERDVILSVGRLTPWKGFGALIEVIKDLIQGNPNFKLLIVGEGKEISNLKSQISNLSLENSVKLVGKISHRDIPFYFKAADIFVLNSEYEGLSHTILEAMYYGIPVIVSNKGGNPELVQDNFNGILVEYNNKQQLKNAVLRLHQDKGLQAKFIQNSYQKLKKFSWENLISQTLDILSQ